jgi:DNA modification methylase
MAKRSKPARPDTPKSTPWQGPSVRRAPDGTLDYQASNGTSIFDPVLCELVYRWFCPPGGLVLDPFAGGSVRGIVAAKLGRRYLGIDLRPEQLAANRAQAARICPDAGRLAPVWLEGDAIDLARLAPEPADLVFTCPPYGDLEVYSADPRDLSTLAFADFVTKYRAIVAAAVAVLKPDRFAAVVVGDFRDKAGFYRRFISATEQAFEDAGARLYNEAVLITAVGSLPIRVGIIFDKARKLGKTHQNVLVFVKGHPAAAAASVGPVERGELLAAEDAPEGAPE